MDVDTRAKWPWFIVEQWAFLMAAQLLKLLVWNVHGLNTPMRRNAISQVIAAVRHSIVCFQESKMEIVTREIIRHCMGKKLENFYLHAVGTRGGIVLAWDATVVTLSNPHRSENTLTTLVKPLDGTQWWITGVYGP